MEPTLLEGQCALVSTSKKSKKKITLGDIIVYKYNNQYIIKRVTGLYNNAYFCTGDNKKHSKDSRTYGSIPYDSVYGRVICDKERNPIIFYKGSYQSYLEAAYKLLRFE